MVNNTQEMIFTKTNARKPWVALLLSVISPGLGHLYNGLLSRAILYRTSMYVYFLIANLAGFSDHFWKRIAVFLFLRLFHIFLIVDSFIIAKRRRSFFPKAYNSVLIYVLFFVISFIATNIVQYGLPSTKAFKIVTQSMSPTLLKGDKVMANTSYYKRHNMQRGDIVLYDSPFRERTKWVDRVIGLPGDSISLIGDTLFLNNSRLHEPYARFDSVSKNKCYFISQKQVFLVPKDSLFVLGDNRYHAFYDSRIYGFVPISSIRGKVIYFYLSEDIKKIGKDL